MNKGIQKIFSEVPKRYELINHLLTFGADIYCRKKAVDLAVGNYGTVNDENGSATESDNVTGSDSATESDSATGSDNVTWVDICSGTGETVIYLRNRADDKTTVIAADFSLPMLNVARQKPEADKIRFVLTDARNLPFADNSIDLITISFATRNLNTNRETLISTFAEFQRVLKSSGRFINLETSQPPNRFFRKLMYLFVGLSVRRIGGFLSGSKSGYKYLSSTIPRFYNADELSKILNEAGFSKVFYKRLFFGFMAIHRARL